MEKWLTERGLATAGVFEAVAGEVRAEVEAAVEFARASESPDPKEVAEDLFV